MHMQQADRNVFPPQETLHMISLVTEVELC